MPIRPELAHFYRTETYLAARARVVVRAGDKCEQCGKPNRARVETITSLPSGPPWMWWRCMGPWTDETGKEWKDFRPGFVLDEVSGSRLINVVCTVAHLDHTPGHDEVDNLRFLCQWCHLHYDQLHHKETRLTRKDRARGILAKLYQL